MKRFLVVLVFVAFTTGAAFAQLSIDAGIATQSAVEFKGGPLIGIAYDLGQMEILAGISFQFESETEEYKLNNGSNVKEGSSNSLFGIYAGVAPKVGKSDKFAFSAPLLLNIRFLGDSETPKVSTFSLDISAGLRAKFSISNHWSLMTGFLLNVLSYHNITNKSASSYTKVNSGFAFFPFDGCFLLGLNYKL